MDFSVKNGTQFLVAEESDTRKRHVVKKGSALQLLCSVDGAPEMRIEWLCWKKTRTEQVYSAVDCQDLLNRTLLHVSDHRTLLLDISSSFVHIIYSHEY